MGRAAQFLPQRGRGTMQCMVEGHTQVNPTSKDGSNRGCPTTTLRVVSLSVPGRN